MPGEVSLDVGVLDFAPNKGMAPLSAQLTNTLIKPKISGHVPIPSFIQRWTRLPASSVRMDILSRQGNDTQVETIQPIMPAPQQHNTNLSTRDEIKKAIFIFFN